VHFISVYWSTQSHGFGRMDQLVGLPGQGDLQKLYKVVFYFWG
jgi:hypothetical protein